MSKEWQVLSKLGAGGAVEILRVITSYSIHYTKLYDAIVIWLVGSKGVVANIGEKQMMHVGIGKYTSEQIIKEAGIERTTKAGKLTEDELSRITQIIDRNYTEFAFDPSDILLLGRESAGVPEEVHNSIPDKVT